MSISNIRTGLRPGVCTSTTRPGTPYTGQIIYETDTGYLRVWDGSAWDYLSQKQDGTTNLPVSDIGKAWTSYTPTVTQGTTTFGLTVWYAKYSQINKTVIVNYGVSISSGTGQASNPVKVSLPVTAATATNYGLGNAWLYDSSANTAYSLVAINNSTTTCTFTGDSTQGNSFGDIPAIQLTTNDQIRGAFMYEAA
jgi:hypothetical protein